MSLFGWNTTIGSSVRGTDSMNITIGVMQSPSFLSAKTNKQASVFSTECIMFLLSFGTRLAQRQITTERSRFGSPSILHANIRVGTITARWPKSELS